MTLIGGADMAKVGRMNGCQTTHPMTLLACDLGGTRLKIGVVRDHEILAHAVEPADSKLPLALHLPVLKAVWLRLLAQLSLSPSDCAGISMAYPSIIDASSGRVLAAFGKFTDAVDLDLRAWAQSELGLPLAIENDARMALIGEWRAGAGRGCDDLVMMTLGTGLGTAAIIEGRVLRGTHGQAGILGGHLSLHYNGGRVCTCGNLGCAEAEASTASLTHLAHARSDFARSPLAAEPLLDFAAVFRHATAADPCAVALRDHSIHVWATLAVNLIHAYDPARLIIGGGIMASAAVILPAIRAHVARHANTPWGQVQIVASTLADNAALVAGQWLLLDPSPKQPT